MSSPTLKQTQIRDTWFKFEQGWLVERQNNILHPKCAQSDLNSAKDWKKLSPAEKKRQPLEDLKAQRRLEIEKKFYADVKQEWHKRLRGAGLRDEDWGQMAPEEKTMVDQGLGAHLNGRESPNPPPPPPPPPPIHQQESSSSSSSSASMALVAAPKLYAPAMSTSSSLSSYEFVNPSELGSDDDADEEEGGRFFNSLVRCCLPSTHAINLIVNR